MRIRPLERLLHAIRIRNLGNPSLVKPVLITMTNAVLTRSPNSEVGYLDSSKSPPRCTRHYLAVRIPILPSTGVFLARRSRKQSRISFASPSPISTTLATRHPLAGITCCSPFALEPEPWIGSFSDRLHTSQESPADVKRLLATPTRWAKQDSS